MGVSAHSFSRTLSGAVLAAACVAALLAAVPTIADHVDDPGLIAYFNADEGGLMDEAWYYYSGIRRDSFQRDIDYGLEMVYLADLSRCVLSKFMTVTPGTLVLTLRWLHLLAWVGALIALWSLIGRHFGRGVFQALAVLLLAVRPSFPYFMHNLKPEPLVLLLIIVGLDCTLRIIESPGRGALLVAVACAAAATVVKFFGVFLLPAIVAALYLSDLRRASPGGELPAPVVSAGSPRLFPALAAIPLAAAPLAAIFLYVRRSNGLTLYQELGFLRSVAAYQIFSLLWIAAAGLVCLSAALFLIGRLKKPSVAVVMRGVDRVCTYATVVGLVFVVLFALIGARWFTMPRHLITTYVYNGMDFSGGDVIGRAVSAASLPRLLFTSAAAKIAAFDPLIFALLVAAVIAEIHILRRGAAVPSAQSGKSAVLFVFLAPLFASLLVVGRFSSHHMLPFFAVGAIVVIRWAALTMREGKMFLCLAACVIMLIDIGTYGVMTVRAQLRALHRREDLVFPIAAWWRANVPLDARIVAEHHIYVYLPEEYVNVRRLHWNGNDEERQLREAVSAHRPRYVYYRTVPGNQNTIRDIASALPDRRLRLVKAFDSSGMRYHRDPGEKFYVYEIVD